MPRRFGFKPEGPVAHREDYEVRECPFKVAQDLVREHHYSKGAANTAVAAHCLVRRKVARWSALRSGCRR
jgi:hypothetical protein